MPYMSSSHTDVAQTSVVVESKVELKSAGAMNGGMGQQLTSFPAFEQIKGEDGILTGVELAAKTDGAGPSSRPPTPPESGTATPRLRIAPCPPRLRLLVPAPNYGMVDLHAIYRSAFPQDRNIDFVKSLRIRSLLTLVDTAPPLAYQQWMRERKIKQTKIGIAPNKEGIVKTTMDSLCEALLFVMDSSNHPVYVHCNQGRHRTGCVVACLRRIQKLPLKDIITEYETYAFPKARPGDIHLIKNFKPQVVFDYAKKNGYFDGSQPRLKRLDSTITDIESLAMALASGAMEDDSKLPENGCNGNVTPVSRASSLSSEGALEMGSSRTSSTHSLNSLDHSLGFQGSTAEQIAIDVNVTEVVEDNDPSVTASDASQARSDAATRPIMDGVNEPEQKAVE